MHGMEVLVTGTTLHPGGASNVPGAAALNSRVKLVAGGACSQERSLHLSGRFWMEEEDLNPSGCEFGADFNKFLWLVASTFGSRFTLAIGRELCVLVREMAPEAIPAGWTLTGVASGT